MLPPRLSKKNEVRASRLFRQTVFFPLFVILLFFALVRVTCHKHEEAQSSRVSIPPQKKPHTYALRFSRDDIMVCESEALDFGSVLRSSQCTSWAQAMENVLNFTEEPVTYRVVAKSETFIDPNLLTIFLRRLSRYDSRSVLLVVELEAKGDCQRREQNVTENHAEYFQFRKGSCSWWQLFLSGTGYQSRIQEDGRTIVAQPLKKSSCGCACGVFQNMHFPQGVDSFLEEFSISATAKQRRYLSKLRDSPILSDMHDSCALVFSSGILNSIEPALGVLIDSHDAVFRMNHAPAGGKFVLAVGNTSTYRVVYVPEYHQHPEISPPQVGKIDDALLLLSIHYKKRATRILEYDLSRTGEVCIVPTLVRERGSKCVFGSFHEYPLEDKQPTGPHLSQGFVGLFLSLHMCKRTVVFGSTLGHAKHVAKNFPFHYHEKVRDGTFNMYSNVHGASEEERFLGELSASGTIALVPGLL